jgi:arylsulfatase
MKCNPAKSCLSAAIATVCTISLHLAALADERPNIIIMMSDDMGYSDIGCYGSEIETPNLDKMATGGLRFTQFYNTARCCPTRASLLTGLYPHQAGVGWMMTDNGVDGYRGNLNKNCMTIAEVLRTAGYRTYMSGKWHVTRHIDPNGPKHNWPLQRGFDRFYGTIHGAGSFFDPNTLTRDNTMISPYADPEYKPEQYYYTDAISDHAVRFINENTKDKPFFMYVAYTAAHWPMHALDRDIEKYKGKYDSGYAATRKARFERMKKLGVIKPDAKFSPPPGSANWGNVKNREWEIRNMEVYAAMIDNMDQGIGRIVGALKANGQLDNTLVMFLQDNGGCAEGLGRGSRGKWKSRPDKAPLAAMDLKALQPNMIPKQTRDGFPVIQGPGIMPGPADTYIAYGQAWANVSNTPFREYKHWVHEGGISTPLIAHWPNQIKRHDELEHQPGHLVDLMATCVDISGAKYPAEFKKQKIKPMEGRSLAPSFGGKQIERDAIYWEHEGNRAVRVGPWKLVAKGARSKWELYNVETDRSELNNVAEKRPERVEQLTAKWQTYAERANVLPLVPYYRRK